MRTDRVGLLHAKRIWRGQTMAGTGPGTELTTVDQMLRVMRLEATVAADSGAEIRDKIANTILAAEDVDDIFNGAHGELQSGRDLVGVHMDLEEVRWNESDFSDNENSFPFYGVVTATRRDTGEQVNFACGAGTAMAQLFRTHQLQAFPVQNVTLREGKTTKSGNKPYSFVRVLPGTPQKAPVRSSGRKVVKGDTADN